MSHSLLTHTLHHSVLPAFYFLSIFIGVHTITKGLTLCIKFYIELFRQAVFNLTLIFTQLTIKYNYEYTIHNMSKIHKKFSVPLGMRKTAFYIPISDTFQM